MLCFIENHEVPPLSSEDVVILDNELVRSDIDVEVVEPCPAYSLLLPLALSAVISEHF